MDAPVEVSALAINVTIPDELRWRDTRRDEEFELQSLTIRMLPDDTLAAKSYAEGALALGLYCARLVDEEQTAEREEERARAHLLLEVLTPIAKDTYLYDDEFNRFELVRDDAGGITGMRFFANGEGEGEIAPLTDKPLPEPRVAIELSPEAITRVSGTYATGPMTLKIYQEGEAMMALMSGQQPVEIFAETPDSFYLTVVPATLEFAPGEVAPTLVLNQNGQEIEFTRAP